MPILMLGVGLVGCGGSGDDLAFQPDGVDYIAVADLPTAEVVRPPCARSPNASLSELPMPRDHEWEAFLPTEAAARGTEFAVDYFVQPFPVVDGAQIVLEFDRATPLPQVALSTVCLESIPGSALGAHAVSNTVVRGEIILVEPELLRRRAFVSVPRGERTLTITLPALDGDPAHEGWYVFFEPATGEQRIAMRWIPTPTGTVEVSGLPNLSGTVALVQSSHLESVDEPSEVIYARYPFSAVWRSAVEAWYGQVVSATDVTATLVRRKPRDAVPLVVSGAAVLTDEYPYAAFDVGRFAEEVTLGFPCGRSARVVVDGYASVTAQWPGGPERSLGPGDARAETVTCTGETGSVVIRGRSLTGRGAPIVTTLEAE